MFYIFNNLKSFLNHDILNTYVFRICHLLKTKNYNNEIIVRAADRYRLYPYENMSPCERLTHQLFEAKCYFYYVYKPKQIENKKT